MWSKVHRRDFLRVASLGTAALGCEYLSQGTIKGQSMGAREIVQIRIQSNYRAGRWSFNPVGLHLQPGQRVRWSCRSIGSSATAFHPSNDNHELRIPEGARPFDSGYMTDRDMQGSSFEWVFEEEGTYDYFSRNHERLGAVGRIVVGSPGGPGERPLGYAGSEGRTPIFPDVSKVLTWLTSEMIVREKVVPWPAQMMDRTFPKDAINRKGINPFA
jgi:plastocyanin